jgi:glycerate kinase
MFENFENDQLEMVELASVKGGNPWWQLAKEVAKSIGIGELINSAKNAGVAAFNGYVDACASGTYDGIPGCKR